MIEYENLNLVNAPYETEYSDALHRFLRKGRYVLGEEVELFEKEFAEFCGSKFCIGVASGLDALYLSLKALDIPKGSGVLVPANTYIATILSIVQAGLRPVLIEPDINTCNIDPDIIEKHITSKIKAIIVVHLYGKMCEMDRITAIANRHGLHIVEDCAQSHGATYGGKAAGTFGVVGAFSFYPTKTLGALGDAGAIITDDEGLAEKFRALRNYGSHQKYQNKYIGINSRLDELQAAFLRIKLRHLNEMNDYKIMLAKMYLEGIDNDNIVLPVTQKNAKDVYHIFNIRCKSRDRLRDYLLDNGIKTEIHYPVPPHKQGAYRKFFKNQHFPISEEIHNTTLSLPVSVFHTKNDIGYIINILNSYC
jgi:dTDP-4-amino-4,6-dideoxygalactose transaminase